MANEIFARACAKWRGILVYSLLQAVTRFVTAYIYAESRAPGQRLFASLVSAATGIYCLLEIWRLLTSDHEGDEAWPPLWS